MGVGGYTGTGYVPGCYMKFNLCVNTMYWVFDDRKKIIKSKICIWLWLNFFVFYTFLCDVWFGHFEWFLIFPTVLHTFDGGAYTGTGYGPGCDMKFNLVLHTSDGGIYWNRMDILKHVTWY